MWIVITHFLQVCRDHGHVADLPTWHAVHPAGQDVQLHSHLPRHLCLGHFGAGQLFLSVFGLFCLCYQYRLPGVGVGPLCSLLSPGGPRFQERFRPFLWKEKLNKGGCAILSGFLCVMHYRYYRIKFEYSFQMIMVSGSVLVASGCGVVRVL